MTGTIFDIKEMAVHDGPGIRTTVFFKSCPLRCLWCHNPEGFTPSPQLMYKEARCAHCGLCRKGCDHPECRPYGRCIHACPENLLTVCGEKTDAFSLAERLKRSAEPLGEMFGGFTFSGGEPLMQHRFLLELIDNLKGYNLCIETSGYAESDVFRSVIEKLDTVIMDIKLYDREEHIRYTGVDNGIILENHRILKESGIPHIIRTPLIPNITDTPGNLEKIAALTDGEKWEKIPYNSAAGAKYRLLGMEYPLEKK